MNYQLFLTFLTMLDFILAAPIPLPIAEPIAPAAASDVTAQVFINDMQVNPAQITAVHDLEKKDVIINDDYTATTTTTGDCSTTVNGNGPAPPAVVTVAQTVVVDGNGATVQGNTPAPAPTPTTAAAATTSTSESVYVTTWPNGEVFYSKLPQTMVSPVNVAPNTSTNNAPTTAANNAPQTTNNAPTTSSTVSSSETEANNAQNTGNSPAPNVPTTSSDAPATTSATSSSSEAPQQNITTSVSTSSTDAQVGAQPTAASSSSTSTSSSTSAPSPSSSGCLTKVPHAIVYSPYDNNRSCKDFSTVLSDLQLIHSKGINELRVYGNDCNYLSTILKAAKQTGFKVNQGFWISDAGVNSIDTAVDDFISYVTSGSGGFGWELFSYLTIGNEAVNSGYCSASDLISKISEVKGKLQNAGYSGKVTTSEPPVSFEKNPSLCTSSGIDFVGINPHSYFDANASADEAGSFVSGQIQIVQGACGNMDIVVTETGYPNQGDTNGRNVPSPENQLIAVQSILDNVSVDVTILTTFEDLWKLPGPYNIEQHFGIIQILP